MRHYMVDPDNEERLLKVPPRVVEAIKAEAYAEAVDAVEDLLYGWGDMHPETIDKIVAPIKRLGGAS